MKKDIHPDYKEVIFQDISTGNTILTRSTVSAKDTISHEGKEYPLVRLEVTSFSHPFYTGKHSIIDTEGRVEKFRQRYSRK